MKKIVSFVVSICILMALVPLNAKAGTVDDMSKAELIEYDRLYDYTVEMNGEVWLKFETKNEYCNYSLKFAALTTELSIADIYVMDSDLKQIVTTELVSLSTDSKYNTPELMMNLDRNSTYYVRVTKVEIGAMEFSVKLLTTSDISDSKNSAESVAFDQLTEGNLYTGSDIDWYTFTTDKNIYKYKFLVNNPGPDVSYVSYVLYDKDLKVIHPQASLYNGRSEEFTLELQPGKKYYFVFKDSFSAEYRDQDYTFKITKQVAKSLEQAPANADFSAKKGTVKAKWTGSANASGYEVRYSLYSNMSKSKKVKTTRKSITIKKLKTKRYYYFQVRAYAKNSKGKMIYSGWTDKRVVSTY